MRTILKQISTFLLGAIAMTGCAGQQGQQQQAAPPAQYQMLTVSTSSLEYTREASATIRGRQDIEIIPQVGGTLQQIRVKEGDKVRKGEVMFVIDQIPFRAAVDAAAAAVANAEAALSTAKLTEKSKAKLYAQKVVSEYDYETAKNSLYMAEAQLASANSQLISAKNNLEYSTVKSPADGVIGVLPYRVGALVSSAIMEPLTTVSDNSVMNVYFSMSENELLSLVREYGSRDAALAGMPAVKLKLSDGSMYEVEGRVASMSGVIDRQTGAITLRADFENPKGLLHSGASGNVVIPTTRHDVIAIPASATYEIQDKVFVVKAEGGVAKSVCVDVTRANGTNTYIVEGGVAVGDQIVAEGVGLLRDGTPIAAKGAAPAAAPAAEQAAE